MHKFFKTLFILLTLLGIQQSYAASTDCIQLAPDGQVNCTKAKSVFTKGGNNPEYDTFSELAQATMDSLCSTYPKNTHSCYLQMEGSPGYPPDGRNKCGSSPTCGKYTFINYNTSSNTAFVAVTILNNSEEYYLDKHMQRSSVVYHLRTCPKNTNAVNVGNDTYLRFCKPRSEVKQNPTSCLSSCNVKTGSATISN